MEVNESFFNESFFYYKGLVWTLKLVMTSSLITVKTTVWHFFFSFFFLLAKIKTRTELMSGLTIHE